MTIHLHAGFIKLAGFVILCGIFASCQAPNLEGVKNTLALKRDAPAQVVNAPLREARKLIPVSGKVVVQEDDNLYSVATRYQVTPQSIIRGNDLVAPYELYAGQILRLKPTKVHVVTITDSLFSLSQRYAVSQFELAQLNQLSEPYALTVGQVLLLPETLDLSVLQIDGLDTDK